jgi:hypothetical protein
MAAPITLSENTRYGSAYLGKPYRYKVFGVAGQLALGNSAAGAAVVNNQFRQKLLGILTGGAVNSTAYMRLQTGLTQIYPEQLIVTGGSPGTSVGPLMQYGAAWTLCDPQHPATVQLGFHMAGSSLLTGLLPGLLSPAYYNLNPTGNFYVLGEYQASPPVMTGDISISTNSILYSSVVPVSFQINRVDPQPVYRPPFAGLNLGDLNLTVLGTPPSQSSVNSGLIQLPDIPTPELLSIAIDLSASQGTGWIKIHR